MKKSILSLAILLLVLCVKAQTITTSPFTSPLCTGSEINVSYTATGVYTYVSGSPVYGTFNSRNVITVQLSDGTGSFSNPVTIGILSTPDTSGTVNCTIPSNITPGGSYQIRVNSSSMQITGTGILVTIYPIPSPTVSGTSVACGVSSVSLSASGGTGYSWSGGTNPSSATNTFFITGVYELTVTNSYGCSAVLYQPVELENALTMNSVSDLTVCANSTANVNFSSTSNTPGNVYNWINNTPGIGLPGSGTGNLAFTAVNNTNTPVIANITATPVASSPTAYVPNRDGTLSVVSVATNQVVSTIQVSTSALVSIAISPDNTKVYVTDGQGTVYVIDPTSNSVIYSWTGDAGSLAISPDGSKLYANNINLSSISVINTATYQVITSINNLFYVDFLLMSPAGDKLYAIDSYFAAVTVISTATNTAIGNVNVPAPSQGSLGAAISPDGEKLYLASTAGHGVYIVNTITISYETNINLSSVSGAISISKDGSKLYLDNSNYWLDSILVVSTITNSLIDKIPTIPGVGNICISPDGNQLFGVGNDMLSVLNLTTNQVTDTITFSSYPGAQAFTGVNFILSPSNCTGAAVTFNITVNPTPVSGITGAANGCGTVLLTGSGIGNYNWSDGNTAVTDNVSASGTYTLTVTNQYSCSSQTSQTVAIIQVDTAGILANAPTCNGLPLNVSFNNNVYGTVYNWTNDNTSIGIVASGTNNISIPAAINNTNGPVVANITVTPVSPSGFAYVANSDSTVSVIALNSNHIINTWYTGDNNSSAAVSPDGARLYVTHPSGNISVINTLNGSIITNISLGSNSSPQDIIFSPDGSKIYVTNLLSCCYQASIIAISTSNYAFIDTINYSSYNWALGQIAISPDGGKLYVANGSLTVFSTSNNSIINQIALPLNGGGVNSATAVTLSPDGNFAYVLGSNLTVINTSTNSIVASIAVGNNPEVVTCSPNGNFVYVSNLYDATVSVINTATYTVVNTVAVGNYPLGISVSADGAEVYVLDNGNGISIINSSSNTVIDTINDSQIPWGVGSFISGTTGVCAANPTTLALTVSPNAQPTISANGPTTFCTGSSVTLNASQGYRGYAWSDARQSQADTFSLTGTYTVTVTDNNGCTGAASQTISVGPAIQASISGNAGPICSNTDPGVYTVTANSANISANTFTNLYSFSGSTGSSPVANLTQGGNGELYGVANSGGANGDGSIFSFNPADSIYTDIFDFNGTNGNTPNGSLTVAPNGILYGTTSWGGANNYGVLFSFNPATSTYTDLFDFNSQNGGTPSCNLLLDNNGLIYGVTQTGGSGGFIFSLNPVTSVFSDVLDFNSYSGLSPSGGLVQGSNGLLYGVTEAAGGANGWGYLFSLNLANGNFIDLYDFNSGTAAAINSLSFGSNGLLYGMTTLGGANGNGNVFSFNTTTSSYTDIFDFNGLNGNNANGITDYGTILFAGNGLLYGMTSGGGSNNAGVLFSLDPNSLSYTKLLDFNGTNGARPWGGLIQASNGLLYGLTQNGGSNSNGNLFSYSIINQVNTLTYNWYLNENATGVGTQTYDPGNFTATSNIFCQVNNGFCTVNTPADTVVVYSTQPVVTPGGPTTFCAGGWVILDAGIYPGYNWSDGTTVEIDSITASGTYTVVVTDTNGCTGSAQQTVTVNRLPVVNISGNPSGCGSVQLTAAGGINYAWSGGINPNTASNIFSTSGTYIITVTNANNCSATASQVVNLSSAPFTANISGGTTPICANSDPGLFTAAVSGAAGAYTDVFDFNGSTGSWPAGQVVQGSNGMLYGLTEYGGASGNGVIFSLDPVSNTYTDLFDFGGNNGSYPTASLALASNGILYGMTLNGGANGVGVLFSFDPGSLTYTDLLDFNGTNGSHPFGSPMVASNGLIYGLTNQGGANGNGLIFSFNPVSASYTDLYDFVSGTGGSPYGTLLQFSNSIFYGVAQSGGANGNGALFSFNINTVTYTDVYDFTSSIAASSLIVAGNGLLYGMNQNGGANNNGDIFSFNTTTNTYTDVFDFNGTNGNYPTSALLQANNGLLYGMTLSGGANGYGVVFSINPNNYAYTDLLDFTGVGNQAGNGQQAYGSLTQASNGLLYGLTSEGGASGNGVMFSFSPPSPYSFKWYLNSASVADTTAMYDPGNLITNSEVYCAVSSNGCTVVTPTSSITVNPNPVPFTITANGPTTICAGSSVTLDAGAGYSTYAWSDATQNETDAFAITGTYTVTVSNSYNCTASALQHITVEPNVTATITGPAGPICFNTDPGSYTATVIPPGGGNTYTDIFDFNGTTGSNPGGPVIQGGNGQLYGLAATGGATGNGAIFSFNPVSNTYTDLFDFTGSNGSHPGAHLVLAPNGLLYGQTLYGGANGDGVLFSFNPNTSAYADLLDFNGTNGAQPYGGLIVAANGLIYGVTNQGGANGQGLIFSYNPATAAYADILDFNGTNGAQPYGTLIQGSNGLLYGVTQAGGAYSYGNLFSLNTANNVFTDLYDLTSAPSVNTLIQGSNGLLYGMTQSGGANGNGMVFSFNLSTSAFADIFDFNGANGNYPTAALTQATNGLLYGMTLYGGANGVGLVFSLDPNTYAYTDLVDFDGTNGAESYSSLMQASNGLLYGVTWVGGANNDGIMFSYNITPVTGTYTYSWYLNDTASVTAGTTTYDPGNLTRTSTVYCAVGSGVCIANSDTITTVVYPSSAPTIVASGQTTFCAGGSVTLDAGSYNAYKWNDSSSNETDAFTVSGTEVVTVTDGNGCTASAQQVVTVNPLPTAAITGNTSGCGSVLLTATGGTTYTWSGGGSVNTATNPFTNSGSYTVTVTDVNGCSNTASQVVSISAAPFSVNVSGGNSPICYNNDPGVYSATIQGGATGVYTDLVDFSGSTGPAVGEFPASGRLCQANDGLLYGVTLGNGVTNGNLFSFNTSTSSYTDIYDFGAAPNGYYPVYAPMQANNGLLYGTTFEGGANGNGIIYSYSLSTGTFTDVFDFSSSVSGAGVQCGLMQASNGLLYGTTTQGGANGQGLIFTFDPASSVYTDVYDLQGTDGAGPNGILMQAANGLLYGNTSGGGVYGDGVIFSFDPNSHAYIKLLDFNGTNGNSPNSLIQGSNGLLYSTAAFGGALGQGLIYSYDPSNGAFTDLLDFTGLNGNGGNGSGPTGQLLQTPDGILHGTTAGGGSWNQGVIFSYNLATNTYIEDFVLQGTTGGYPYGSLMQASNGLLYGTDGFGGAYGFTGSNSGAGVLYSFVPVTYTYNWYLNNTATGITTSTYDPGNLTTSSAIYCAVSSAGCTVLSSTSSVAVDTLPVAVITASGATTFCNGGTVTLDAGSTFSAYIWSDSTSTENDIISSSGSYYVTVTDGLGCTGTAMQSVTVNPNPAPVITANGPTVFCAGGSVKLDAGSYQNYLWSDGNAVETDSVYTSALYNVTVTDINGCTGSASQNVVVNPNPMPVITAGGPTAFCFGGSVSIDAGAGYNQYNWNDGSTIETDIISTSGNYVIIVTDGNGCTGSASQIVSVDSPSATITGPTGVCSGSLVVLDAGIFSSYMWNDGTNNETDTITLAGTYSVTVTDSNGCTATTSESLNAYTSPVPVITANGPTSFCNGGIVILNAGGNDSLYVWSDGETGINDYAYYTALRTVTVTDFNGCTGSASQNVTVYSGPNPVISTSGPLNFCTGNSISLSVGSSVSYAWSNGGSGPSITVSNEGNFYVTVTDTNGCSNYSVQHVAVVPEVTATVSGGADTLCSGHNPGNITVSATGGEPQWETNFNTVLHFNSTGGSIPGSHPRFGRLCKANNGLIYGATNFGGSAYLGTIYVYNPATNAYTNLHDFTGTDGAEPEYNPIQSNSGLLYGVTSQGGVNGGGVLYSYNIATSAYIKLADFPASTHPESVIETNNGLLYIETQTGCGNAGSICSYDPGSGNLSVVHCFDPATGYNPQASTLMQASNGLLYGTTLYGGNNSTGVLFSFDPTTGNYTVLHNFLNQSTPTLYIEPLPFGGLIQASNGLIYGSTWAGGIGDGTIFSFNPTDSTFNDVYVFNDRPGYWPFGQLQQALNGRIYGITMNGQILSFNPAFNDVIFLPTAFTATPTSGLIQTSDGTFYGTVSGLIAQSTSLAGSGDTAGAIYAFKDTAIYSYRWYLNSNATSDTTKSFNPGTLTSTSTIYCQVTAGCTANSSIDTITVTGGQPVITCPHDTTITCNAATDPGTTGTATATGGCGTPTVTYSDSTTQSTDTTQSAHYVYDIFRTWKAADVSGNTDSCRQHITIRGGVILAQAHAYTVILNDSGLATLYPSDIDAGSYNICGGNLTYALNDPVPFIIFTCANVGYDTVTLVVADAAGDTSTATAVVIVKDTLAPKITCTPFTVYLDANGADTITTMAFDTLTYDPCGIDSEQLSKSIFTCSDRGVNQITYTATNVHGLTSLCTTTVTVLDTIRPTVICQPVTVQLDLSGHAYLTAAQVNNGSYDNCAIANMSVAPSTFTCANIGLNTVVLSVTDSSGNSSSCSTTVTVQANTLTATINGGTSVCAGSTPPGILFTAGNGTAPYTFSYNINGGATLTAATIAGSSTVTLPVSTGTANTYIYTLLSVSDAATPACPQTASGSATVTVNANPVPVITANGPLAICNGQSTILDAGIYSSYNWNNTATTETVTAGTGGNYSVTVTDMNGCSGTALQNISVYSIIGASITGTDVSCFNGSNGTIALSNAPSGGASPYQYSINGVNYQTGTSFTNLTPNTYNVTTQDANGCTAVSNNVTIAQPAAISTPALTVNANELCYGNSVGSVTVSTLSTGGTGAIEYALNGGTYQSSTSFSGLAAGPYTAVAKDANGCTSPLSALVTITQPMAISSAAISGSNISCSGYGNGSISLSTLPSGGVSPYLYSLNNSAYTSSTTYTLLSPGNYSLNVKDANGCIFTTNTVNIAQPAPLSSPVLTVTNNGLCPGSSTGVITVSTASSGGTGAIQYSLNGGPYETGTTFSSLAAGNYAAIAKDDNGCTSAPSGSVSIVPPSVITAPTLTVSANENCNGDMAGVINVSTASTGGTGTIQYSLNSGNYQTGLTFGSLPAGVYTAIAQDANGCNSTNSASVSVTQPTPITTPVLTVTANVNCTGNTTGTVVVSTPSTGGTGAIQYSLNGGAYQSATTFSGLTAGTYSVVAKDANGCISSTSASVGTTLTVVASNTGPYSVGQTINLVSTVTGNSTNYTYSWSGPALFSSANANPLINNAGSSNSGVYTITVTDNNGCSATASTTVSVNGVSVYTWTGTNGTSWTDGTNWSPNITGGPNACWADVIIPAASNQPVVSAPVNVGNITIDAAAQLTLNANLSVCKNIVGGASGQLATVVGNGIIILDGNTLQIMTGAVQLPELELNNAVGAQMQTGSAIDIYTALDLRTGNFDATNGALTFKSNTVDSVGIIDNFSQGYAGTLTGNITAERYYATSLTYSQHYMGSPINNTSLVNQWGAAGTAGEVTDTRCDETQLNGNSVYGTVFTLDQSLGAPCSVVQWVVLTSGNAQNGLGYSILKNGTGKVVLNGQANLNANYQISNLQNDGWTNVTLQGRPDKAGWQLLSNPYLATLELSTTPTGFDNQVQIWNANGLYAGTFQPGNIGANAVVAPFQGFMVHKTTPGGTATYIINATDRVRTPQQFYQQNANELKILATNITTGMLDQTTVAFNSAATDTFDAQYDAQKIAGSLERHTIYTENNNMWMARNVLHSEATTSTVPMGFEPGKTGNYSFSFGGVNTFDPTSYIYLEDRTNGQWYNVRNGNYSFNADSADAWSRFVLHFTPPASITTTDATCNTGGTISIQQPGTANWNYYLTDSSSNVIAHGTLNQTQPVTLQEATGTYTLTLTDTNNYVAVKTIQVNGPAPVSAAFMVSADTVIPEQTVVVVANTQDAASYLWNFGNGMTGTGSQAMVSYTQPGVYILSLVVANNAGCTSSQNRSIKVRDNATGLTNLAVDGDLTIWSNANKVYVDFTALSDVDATVIIYNMLGQEISNEHYTNNNVYQKEIDKIEAAYMVVMVRNANRITTRKVIITNLK